MTMDVAGAMGGVSKGWTRGRVEYCMHVYCECCGVVILSVACVWVQLTGHLILPSLPCPPPSLTTAQGNQGHPRLPPEGPKVRTACRIHGGEGRDGLKGRVLRVWCKCIHSLGLACIDCQDCWHRCGGATR